MAEIQFVASSLPDSMSSSSKAKYQFPRYLVTEHSTMIISRMPIENTEFSNNATVKVPPGNAAVRTLLFPFFVSFFLLRDAAGTDLVITDRSGDAILPVLLLQVLIAPWLVLSADSPDGKIRRRRREDRNRSLVSVHEVIMQHVAFYGFGHADSVVLSDETDIVEERRKHVIRGGVDCGMVDTIAAETDTRPASDRVRVVYVGNMYYHRGIDVLFEALQDCSSEVEVVLVGPPPTAGGSAVAGEFQHHVATSLEAAVEALPVPCRYEGRLSHRTAIREMLAADIGICLLPYERGLSHFRDSYPIKLFEYMYTETAVVATRTPTTQELLDDQQLVPTEDAATVTEKIQILVNNPELLGRCKERNKDVVAKHCWEDLLSQLNKAVVETIRKGN